MAGTRFPSAADGYDRDVVDRFVAYSKQLFDSNQNTQSELAAARGRNAHLESEIAHLKEQLLVAKQAVEKASELVTEARTRAEAAFEGSRKATLDLRAAEARELLAMEAKEATEHSLTAMRSEADHRIAEAVSRSERLEIQLELAQRNGFELQADGTVNINLAKIHAPTPTDDERTDKVATSLGKRRSNSLPKLGIEEPDIWAKHLSNRKG